MGIYYGVRCVEANGTLLVATEKQPMAFGTKLVMILDNGLWKIAVDVTDEKEYNSFYHDYALGNWLKIKVFSVPKEVIRGCPDEGRVKSTYYEEKLM